jgi:hypothetical protein
MALNLVNLDKQTRPLMLGELELDVANGTLYLSPRLSSAGSQDYEHVLREAIAEHDDAWFADTLRSSGCMNEIENTARGPKRIPHTAPETLAEGEFNRFYARGLSLRAIEEKVSQLVIYRAKAVSNPRPESEALIGREIDPRSLLPDLRTNPGRSPAFGLPPGPNSGLSVRLP